MAEIKYPEPMKYLTDAVTEVSGFSDPVFALLDYLDSVADYGVSVDYIYSSDVGLLCMIMDEAVKLNPCRVDEIRHLQRSVLKNITALWSMATTFAQIDEISGIVKESYKNILPLTSGIVKESGKNITPPLFKPY